MVERSNQVPNPFATFKFVICQKSLSSINTVWNGLANNVSHDWIRGEENKHEIVCVIDTFLVGQKFREERRDP